MSHETLAPSLSRPAAVPATAEAPAVEVSGLGRRYGRRWALIGVDLTIPRGQMLVVAGRNGSGKSTLLRVLATLLTPDRGRGSVEGFDIVRQREEVRKRMALLSHYAYNYDSLTALENLQIAARFLRKPAGRQDVLPLLEELGLAERADDPVSTFSAGMRKRLSLARVLLQEPSLVLLDEPYGQLDPPGFLFVDRLLAATRRRGATVVMATHLLERAAGHGDRAVILDEGRLAWNGPAAELPQAARGDGLQEGGAC